MPSVCQSVTRAVYPARKTKLLPALVAWTLLLSLTSLFFYYP